MLTLSGYFPGEQLLRDGEFESLGHANCGYDNVLVYCETVHYVKIANNNPNVSCVITNNSLADTVSSDKGVVISESPRYSFYELHEALVQDGNGIHSVESRIGENCNIHPTATVSSRSCIGNNVTIKENVVICDGVTIGDNVYMDVGSVVGVEGILYVTSNGDKKAVRHSGGVIIGNGVTLLSNAVVVKSIHPRYLTRIGDCSIIGIASTIGHDAQIGRSCVISGNCVVARGAMLEDEVYIGTSSVVREYISLGKNSQAKAGSIVVDNVPANGVVSGNFAVQHRKHLLDFAKMRD